MGDKLNQKNEESFPKWKKTEMIIRTAIGSLTIIVSIIGVSMTNSAQLKQQRFEAAREIKRTYYNQFIEAYTNKLQFYNKPDSLEKVEAEIVFVQEVNRLPLYASQEMVEFVNSMWDKENATLASTSEFYDIMRRDLCSDEFLPFENLEEFPMAISNNVVVLDLNGQKNIQ